MVTIAKVLTILALPGLSMISPGAGATENPNPGSISIPAKLMKSSKEVPPADMRRIYEEVKTPYKYGVVLRGEEGELVDCPSVFRFRDKWYMIFVANKDNVGYQTFLAESDNLLDWKRTGRILSFAEEGWDRWQADGGAALVDHEWNGSAQLQRYQGRYWLSYLGGALQGYEPDPLSIGIAWTESPDNPAEWTRYEGNPVLTPDQPSARAFEARTLYKSTIIWDHESHLGWPFVMYYNGKDATRGSYERIGMAVSADMIHWHRYGEEPVISNETGTPRGISGDPQVVKIGDLWVMFYFGAFWKPGAFDTFACSYDLVNWTKWEGPHLIEPSEPWDQKYAHKPWLLKHDGIVYHFYCAVGDEGRAIALATSSDLETPNGSAVVEH